MTAPKSNKRGRAALVVVLCLLALCLAAGGTVYGLLSRKVKAIQPLSGRCQRQHRQRCKCEGNR